MIDHLCAARDEYLPFRERAPVAFGSYAERCPYIDEFAPPLRDFGGTPLPECPRKYYWELAQNHSDALDVRLHGKPVASGDGHYKYMLDAKRAGAGAQQRPPYGHSSPVSLTNHSRYKYVLDTDGTGRACRFEQLLALGGVVLKAQSRWTAHFSGALVPGEHYLPVYTSSADDVLKTVAYLEANPDVAERIARAGQEFACEHLTLEGRKCTWASVLGTMRGLLQRVPTPAERPWLSLMTLDDVQCPM
eukprot:7098342-Prymnesium_polylepis.1